MRGGPIDSQRRSERAHDGPWVRTDGAGVGLFGVTACPAIEYAVDGDTTVVERVNQAFADTFDITDEMAGVPLSTTMDSVTVASEEYAPLVEGTRDGAAAVVTCRCATATGRTAFRVRTTPTDGRTRATSGTQSRSQTTTTAHRLKTEAVRHDFVNSGPSQPDSYRRSADSWLVSRRPTVSVVEVRQHFGFRLGERLTRAVARSGDRR